MKRRDFLKLIGYTGAGALVPITAVPAPVDADDAVWGVIHNGVEILAVGTRKPMNGDTLTVTFNSDGIFEAK